MNGLFCYPEGMMWYVDLICGMFFFACVCGLCVHMLGLSSPAWVLLLSAAPGGPLSWHSRDDKRDVV